MTYKQLLELRKCICNEYLNQYSNLGFSIAEELPLDCKNDVTLDFTTCTICKAKPFIKTETIGNDYVMIQPAMRNTHVNEIGYLNSQLPFLSCFTMMGGFLFYDNVKLFESEFNNVVYNEFKFLKKYFEKIILTIPEQYNDRLPISEENRKLLLDNCCDLKYSNCDMENLKWKYGIDKIIGYGTRWELINKEKIVNWGNTICVYKENKPIGIDFGGGLETLIYAKEDIRNSKYANDLMTDYAKEFCEEDLINEKIFDCITSLLCMISNKDKIILRDRVLLTKYLKLLYGYMIISNQSEERVFELLHSILKSESKHVCHNYNIFEKFKNEFNNTKLEYEKILLNPSINELVNLINMCYNENENWLHDKRVRNNHLRKYFVNLSEVELLAVKKMYERQKIKEMH